MPGGVASSRGDEHSSNKPPFLSTLKHGKSDIIYIDDFDVATGAGFDLYFFCSDGVVSAHRLVISNVSKFVMTMLDDQPMWHPSHIHVPDLPKTIMQILVDLAYTGEMKFPMDLQSDVFDAMQTLGWIHTDCLSADFCDTEQGSADVDKEGSKVNKEFKKQSKEADTKESPVSPKMHFSLAGKGNAQDGMPSNLGPTLRLSFNEELDESMELSRVPDLILSDDDELVDSEPKSPGRTGPARKRFSELKNDLDSKSMPSPKRTTRGGSVQKSVQPVKKEKAAPKKSVRERKDEKKPEEVSNAGDKTIATENVPKKRGRKPKVEKAASSAADAEDEPEGNHISEVETATSAASVSIEDCSQTSTTSESSQNDSPGKRQRRKPKRFEDFEEIPERTVSPSKAKPPNIVKDKPKPKVLDFDSNVSTSSQNKRNAAPAKNKEDAAEEILILSQESTPKTVSIEKAKPSSTTKLGRKKKYSGESPKQSSLITAYFSKQKDERDSPSLNSASDNHEEEATKGGKLVQKSVDPPSLETSETNSNSENTISTLENTSELDAQTEFKGRATRKKPSSSVDSSNQKMEKAKGISKPATSDSEQEQLASGNSEVELELVGLPVPSPGSSRPSRKSSRVSSRSSVAPSEGKNDDEEPTQPIKKRARKEEPEENNLKEKDNIAETEAELPGRRSSKK